MYWNVLGKPHINLWSKESEVRASSDSSPPTPPRGRGIVFSAGRVLPLCRLFARTQQTWTVNISSPSPHSMQVAEPILLAPESGCFAPIIADQGPSPSERLTEAIFPSVSLRTEKCALFPLHTNNWRQGQKQLLCDLHFSRNGRRNILVQELKPEDEQFTCGRWSIFNAAWCSGSSKMPFSSEGLSVHPHFSGCTADSEKMHF